jgi:hypothetical protein
MATLPISTVWTQVVAAGASPVDDQWTQRALGTLIDLPDGARLLVLPYAVPPVEQAQVFINDVTLVMSAIGNLTIDEGTTSTFTPTLTGGTNPRWTISGPAWTAINASTGLVSLSPPLGTVGITDVTVFADNTCNVASRTFSVAVSEAAVAAGLRAQVEQLGEVGQTGPRTPPTKVYGVDTPLPPGVTDVGGTLVLGPGAILEGWSNITQVDLVGDNAVLRDCVVDNTAEANAGGYYVHITGNGCTVEYCTVKGAGLPSNSLGANAPSNAIFNDGGANTTIRRNWILDYPNDGIKSDGENVLIEHNLFDRAVATPVGGFPVYNPSLSYPRGSRVQISAGDPRANAAAIVEVLPGQAPGATQLIDNAFWNGLDVHTDQVTIFGGSGAVRQNLFKCDPERILGPTQQIRVVRNTFLTTPIGKFEISGNVLQPWAGSWPLDAGVIRAQTGGTAQVGGFVAANIAGALRYYEALEISSLATQGPAAAPERWQEVTDINATDALVVLAHNWLAAGDNGGYATWGSGGETFDGHIVYGPNSKEIDGLDAMALLPDFQVADLTIPAPAFGAGVVYTAPVSRTGSDFTITPTAFGKFKVGGVLIDACVIRSGSRIICWMTPDGTVTTRANVPATVEDLGTSFRVRFLDASGAPIDAPLAVAAGTAAVVDNNGMFVASIIGQSENVVAFTHNGSFYTAGPYPALLAGVDAQIAMHPASNESGVADIEELTSDTVDAKSVSPGFVALANLWHLVTQRPLRLVADVRSGSDMQDMMDAAVNPRDFADSVALVALAASAWGAPITSVTYNWWNGEASVSKTLWNSRAPHFFGINPDGSDYDFDAGTIEHCLIDTTGRGYGLLPPNTKVHLMLPGIRLTEPGTATNLTPHTNYNTRADGLTAGMTPFAQNSVNAYEMRDDFISKTPVLNQGKVTIAPNLVRFGDYTNGVKDADGQTEIHPGMKDPDGQILFSQDVAASLLVSEGYAQVSRLNRVTQLPDRKTFDFVFRVPTSGVLHTQRIMDDEPVASPRPHQQQAMGFEVARGADTLSTQRPLYRADNTDDVLYPVNYRGTATITNSGTDVGGGVREATVRVVMVNALNPGDRIHWTVTGGAGGWQLHDGADAVDPSVVPQTVPPTRLPRDHIDYDARLYRDGLRVYEARLDDGSATRYPGIPVRGQEIYIVQSYGADTAPSITTAASVSSADGGATVTYIFTPPAVAGSPTPTVTRVLTLGGTDVTSAMSGNVYVATKTGTTQALVMTYTASNGVSPNATSTASATVPATSAAAFFTMPGAIGSTPTIGQNPRFTGLSDLPAATTGIRLKAKLRLPALVSTPPQQNLMNFASTSAVIHLTNTRRLRCTLEDALGNARLAAQEFGPTLALDTWHEIDVLLDQVAGTVSGTIGGTAFTPLVMNTTAGASSFATNRLPTLLASSTGVDPVTSGVQVEYLELSYVSSGTESVIKRIEGAASTVNSDAWKVSGTDNVDFV